MATISQQPVGNYVHVNGVKLYYEVHGTGKPLIVLHSGFGTCETLSALTQTLAEQHQVIGVDLYGHGRTALTERPLRYEDMADDIAGLLAHLELAQSAVLGYSLGGGVALQTAFRHPNSVSKLVVISAPFKWTGWYPDVRAGMAAIAVEFMAGTPIYDAYVQVAPHPEDFARLVAAMREVTSQDYDWTEQVAALKIPTLLVAGDADSFPPSHAAEFFALLGGGARDAGWNGEYRIASQLAILPGTTHYTSAFRTDLLPSVLLPFLADK